MQWKMAINQLATLYNPNTTKRANAGHNAHFWSLLDWIATLMWWGGLCAPRSLRAMLAGPLEVLVGSPCLTGQGLGARQRAIYWSSRLGVLHRANNTVIQKPIRYGNSNEKLNICDGLSESSPRTRMTADCEATRNSASRRTHMSGSGQIQEEATAMALQNVRTMYEQGKKKTALHRTPEESEGGVV